MSEDGDDDEPRGRRVRREPPPLHPVTVVEKEERSPRMLRLTLEGPGLSSLVIDDPAASVRLLVPSVGHDELVIPSWNGNEFLLDDGTRPVIRTFTPLRLDAARGRLDLEIVRHRGGAVSGWAGTVPVGAAAAISGPGRGYRVDRNASRFLVLGDETAMPAISQLLQVLPAHAELEVHIEVAAEEAIIEMPDHPGCVSTWHVAERGADPGTSLVERVEHLDGLDRSTRVWAAGEAAAVQAMRVHLFRVLGVPRAATWIRGYWKMSR